MSIFINLMKRFLRMEEAQVCAHAQVCAQAASVLLLARVVSRACYYSRVLFRSLSMFSWDKRAKFANIVHVKDNSLINDQDNHQML